MKPRPQPETAPDPLLDRGLPSNPEAEKAVLGSVLLDNRSYNLVSAMLNPEDFFIEANRRIYARMVQLRESNRPVDYTTLTEELLTTKELEAIGGITYLSSLTDGLPRASNIEHYARIVRDKAELRRLIHTAHGIAQEGLDGTYADGEENQRDGLSAFIARSQQKIMGINARSSAGMVHVSTVVPALDRMLRGTTTQHLGVPTGFPELDKAMACGGWATSELSAILARTGHGKTSFMLACAVNSAMAGNVTGIVSLETKKERLLLRMACQWAGVSLFKALHHMLNSLEWDLIQDALRDLSKLPIFIEDTPGLNAVEINGRARCRKAEEGTLASLYIDYLGLVSPPPGRWENQNVKVAETMRILKQGAGETGDARIILIQIARSQNVKQGDAVEEPPRLSDGRDSGEIENQTYTVAGLYRLDQAKKKDRTWVPNGEGQIELLKDKDGPGGIMPLLFDAKSMRFTGAER